MAEVYEGEVEDVTSIVVSGGLSTFESFDPSGYFDAIVDAETARRAVGKIKVFEEMLKTADQFGAYASKFCLLEAQMYVQISEVDNAEDKLTDGQRNIVSWLRGKTDEEISAILEECAGGKRIRSVRQAEMRDNLKATKQTAADREYERISNAIVKELETEGHTQLTPSAFLERWNSIGEPNTQTIKAYTERTRDKLLKRSGRGLGDSKGTYMLVGKCDHGQVASIVKTRLESIVSDLKTLKKICDETGFVIPQSGVKIIVDIIRSLGASEQNLDLSL